MKKSMIVIVTNTNTFPVRALRAARTVMFLEPLPERNTSSIIKWSELSGKLCYSKYLSP